MGLVALGRRSFALVVTAVCLSLVIAALGRGPAAAAEDDPAPVLGGQLFSTGSQVTVEVLAASAGLTSTLFLLDPEEVRIATNRDVGTSVTVGPYARGEELVFGIRVGGSEFRLGDGARNPDGIAHAVVDFGTDGCAVVGFEDLFGGGDRDYDDNRFRFCGGIAPEQPEDPEEPPAPDPVRDPVADAGADQQVTEGSTVTLDGSASKASTKPGLQATEESGALPGGTSLDVAMTGLDEDAQAIRVKAGVGIGQGPPAQNTSIAYVLDVSGSTGGTGCGGDVNRDNRSNTILDCEIAAALKLHEEVVASGTVDKVAVIGFSTGANALDLDPTAATSTMVAADADADGNGELDIVQALRTLRIGGGTNFLPPTRTACQMLATTGSPNLITAFMSDGQGSGRLNTVLPCDPPVKFHSFAVGSGSKCASGSAVGARLIDMATLSGGTCTDVPTVTTLPDILPQVVASTITSVSYTVDGGAPVDLSETLSLPAAGPVDLDVTFDLPDDLATGTHRICLTVSGEDFGGESSLTTCSDLVTVTGEVGYSWRVADSTGPPIFLSSRTSARPSFVAPDDGRYVLELTVSDGTGGTATDRVVVVVTNVDPTVDLSHGDSFAGGVTQVNGSLTDEGWLDGHVARVAWGDGTVDEVEVTTSGAGWGTFFASHVYRTAGAFDVVVTLTDDDGGTASARVDHLEVATPVAVWANAEGSPSLDWSGGSGDITGRVHTNGRLRFVGDRKSVVGPTTYAGSIAADTTKNSFVPEPALAPVTDYPVEPAIADFRPGGAVQAEVGPDYHDMSSACAAGSWHEVQQVLTSGVYYATCDIQLNGSDIGGRVTLVSEGHIRISGSKPAFESYHDGLLLLAGASGAKAIDIAAASSKFLGVVFAGAGEISISGRSNQFYCGVLGDQVSISGAEVSVRGADCGRPDDTVSGPVVVPDLTTDISVDRDRALPSDTLGFDITVGNDGATLVVPSLIGLENVDAQAATVTDYGFAIEREDVATGAWVPVAVKGDDDLRIDLRANPFEGVTYAAGDVAGTSLQPGGWATWGVQAVLTLTPDEIEQLLDPAVTGAVRTRVDFTLDPSTVQARRLYTYGSDFAPVLRDLGADATDTRVTTLLPDGDAAVLTSTEEPALARLAPGETAELRREWAVPVPSPRADGETDAGYLARLVAQDGTQLNGAAFALAAGGVGRLVAPLVRATSTRELPVVGVSTVGPESLAAGASADYQVRLANLGSADADALTATATADQQPLTVTGAPSSLAAGEVGEAAFDYTAAVATSGTTVLRGTATWRDARGNAYGASGSSLDVERQLPAALGASLTDALHVDQAGDNVVSPGDTVRYAVTVRNSGGQPLTGVSGTLPVPAGSSFVPGSGRTPDGGSIDIADGTASFSLPDIPGGATRLVTVDVVVDQPFPVGVSRLQAQGTVLAAGSEAIPTDDPALPGSQDPTRTTVTRPQPALTASLGGRLVVDADGSGGVSPGDTLAYEIGISSVGTQQVTGVRAVVEPPPGAALVDGSVRTSQGVISPGASLDVAVGTLAPFQQATIEFRLRVANPLPAGVTTLTATGTITSDQLDPIVTDDPRTVTVGDGTSIPIGGSGADPELPGPTVGDVSLTEGTIVTEPVQVRTTLTPPDGQTLAGWTVTYQVPGDPNTVVVGTGTGPDVDVTLDPTTMPNGAYVVTVRGTTSNGGATAVDTSIVVDGEMKLGRYTTTITDMTVGMGGVPISVNRTYDSFDKTVGDFGVGWDVSLADFSVSTNGPLGLAGWSMTACGAGLIFVPLCFVTDNPHFVTVTWPDGRNEVFDLTPAKGSTFVSGLTTAQFTGREDTTSTLTAVDSSLFFSGGNLNGGFYGIDGIYDPTSFVLQARGGTEYHLTVGKGLTKIVETTGETLTFGRDGVRSSSGPAIDFHRDAAGRIDVVTGPDGSTVRYGYDTSGDLVSVTDQRGNVTRLSYKAGHYLDTVEDPLGRPAVRMEYTDGRLTAVIDGEGNRTEIGSSVGLRQETVTDPGGKRVTITSYDERGWMVRRNEIYDGASHVTEFGYDAAGNLTYRKDPDGNEWRSTWTKGSLTSMTPPSGATSSATYSPLGQLLTWTDPLGGVTRYTYNANGTLATVTDPEGATEAFTYDGQGRKTGWTDANGEVWAWVRDAAGRVVSETDPEGGLTRFEYDTAGRLVAEVDPEGGRTTMTYDEAGQLRTETDADGRTRRWVYDSLGQLTRAVSGTGVVEDYTYDRAGRRLSLDNHVDAPTTYSYDAQGRVVSEQVGDHPARVTTYDGAGNVASVTDELGHTTSYTHSSTGKLLSETDASGATTTYDYTSDGALRSRTDGAGGVTRWTYTARGDIATVTNPSGITVENTYDGLGRLRLATYPDGSRVENVYDPTGQVVRTIDADGDVTRYEYDGAGRPTATVDPEGRRTTTEYDGAGRPVRVVDAGGGVSLSDYTPGGLLSSVTTPEGVTTRYEYDARGRATAVVDELGNRWTSTYDDMGRLLTTRDPRQQGAARATQTHLYDRFGRLASTTDALGATVSFGYDAAGRRTRVTDPRGKDWTVTYDERGDVVARRDPLGRTHRYTYDAAGRLSSHTDARGVSVDYAYRGDGQPLSMTERGGDGRVSMTYDGLGRRASMTDDSGLTSWSYTPGSQVAGVSTPAGAISYTYDRSGRRSSMTQPAGEVRYAYDAAGRLDSITDWEGRTTDTAYDSDGRIRSMARPNGVESRWTYDAAGRLTAIRHTRDGSVVEKAEYALDADGNRTAVTTTAGTETYELDAADQLTSVTYAGGRTEAFTYDAAGNRLTSRSGADPQVSYAYDDASQLVAVGGRSIVHDDNGNVVDDGTATYDWDWLDRMVSVETGGQAATFGYDGAGTRVSTTVGQSTTRQLHDSAMSDGRPRLVADGTTSFVQTPEGVLAQQQDDTTSYPLLDALGSVRTMTDAQGAVAGRASYDVFGAVSTRSGATSRFGFGGGLQDGALVHLGARDLSTTTGRFLSTDPMRPGSGGVVGWNPYSYVGSNPTTFVDPTGMMSATSYGLVTSAIITEELVRAVLILGFATAIMFTVANVSIPQYAPPTVDRRPRPTTEPQTGPRPIPRPYTGTRTRSENRCLPRGMSGSWYDYLPPQQVQTANGVESRAWLAIACIAPGHPSGTAASYTPPGYIAGVHNRGHLIGKALGGSGSNPGNIVPLFRAANYPTMYWEFEEQANAKVAAGETLYYQVNAYYTDDPLVPNHLRMAYNGDRGSADSYTLDNVP
ncbi:RHS repeat-associated core domain-containing protein [uncultured Nocardioides sp.]|uniref:RHS repeat-associated core domain-containing protein n=1 Tax=uncultured Nocardioides sp. TaxID=198441 RepID=UPI0026371AB5|nr:RHS repeat-associated core domain-containing protein [uncultured Nocardioides sp.]